MRGKPVSASSVVLSRVMHPNEASYMGTVHGGVILRMLDEAGGMAAFRHARKPVVTAAIDSMSFFAPVYVGNLVTAKASVNSVGETSPHPPTLFTWSWAGTPSPSESPPLIAMTADDQRRMAEAELRRKARTERRMAGRVGR